MSTLETSITNQAQKILLGCGILSSVLYFAGWVPLPHLIYSFVAVGVLIWAHRDNIGRLRAGTERKLF